MNNRNFKKQVSILLVFCLSILANNSLFAQVSKGGTPPSFSLSELRTQISGVKMPTVNTDSLLAAEKKEREQNRNIGMPFRFGFAMDVNLGLDNSGTWETVSNGDKIWRLKIYSEGALSLNLIYDKFWLPEGATFFVYGEDKKTVLGAFTAETANNKFNNFATDIISGNTVILEYFEPKGISGGIINIGKVIHGYKTIFGRSDGLGASGDCNIDIHCPLGDDWALEKNAVSMILVDYNTAVCTGCLINNTLQDKTPYYLTANHCFFNFYGDNPNPSTSIFRFKYWRPTCNGSNPSHWESIVGATILSNWAGTDFALLKLSSRPSFPVYYAGWDRRDIIPSSTTGIHHPSGDVMKISVANNAPSKDECYANNTHVKSWNVVWDNGTTEPGSSGSPLFNESRRIIGQLCRGNADCDAMFADDCYGRFYLSWEGGDTNESRLSNWLDPNNSGVLFLDGICSDIVRFTDQVVSSDTTVTSPCDIYVENVTVESGVTLIFEAGGTVIIGSDFEVELGADFEIR